MFDMLFDIDTIIPQIEVTLKVNEADYGFTADIGLNRVLNRLQEQYAIDFEKTSLVEQGKVDPNIGRLIENLASVYQNLAAYSSLCRYYNNTKISLSNVARLRTSTEALSSFLVGCANVQYQDKIESPMTALTTRYIDCPLSKERKLIFILLLFYKLKLFELVGVLADMFLYSLLEGEDT